MPTFVAARACGFEIAPLDLTYALPSVPFKFVPFKFVPFKSLPFKFVPQWLGPLWPELASFRTVLVAECLRRNYPAQTSRIRAIPAREDPNPSARNDEDADRAHETVVWIHAR